MIEDVISTLNNLVEGGKRVRQGPLAELADKIKELHEFEIIEDRDESAQLVTLLTKIEKSVKTALTAAKSAAQMQRADEASTSAPAERMMQYEQFASGAFVTMNTHAKLLAETEKHLDGKWKDKPDVQKVQLLRKHLARTRAGLDNQEVKRQRREFEKNRRAHESEVNATGGADVVHEEEVPAGLGDADADSDNEFGASNLVDEGVRRVFGTKGHSLAVAATM